MYKRILVPVDLTDTDSSQAAMSVAEHLSELTGARLTIVSVVPESPGDGGPPEELQSRLDDLVRSRRSGYTPPANGALRTSPSIAEGIVEAAKDAGADLIVMASHDPTTPGAKLGSRAAHVLTHTPCSVLSVR